MFTYTDIENACKRLSLDPKKRGKNIWATSKSIYAKDKPASLKKLGFPKEERDQIEIIGKIINNLTSQMKSFHVFDSTNEKGRKEFEMHRKIEKFLPTANASLTEWFATGAKKAKKKVSDFTIDHGIIHEVDKEAVKSMEKMNETGPRHMNLSRKRYYEKLR